MSKLLNTLLLSTALVCYSNSYSLDANGRYNILYDAIDSGTGLNSFLFGDKCVVGDGSTALSSSDSTNKQQLGQLYYKDGETWQKLIDDEDRPYFDLSTVVTAHAGTADTVIENYIAGKKGGWNLIIKNCDGAGAITYTLNNPIELDSCNTNLIIPNGITLTRTSNGGIIFNDANNTVLILGAINSPDLSSESDGNGVVNLSGNSKAILGPDANFNSNKGENNTAVLFESNCNKFVLYPGSTTTPEHDDKIFALNKGNVYLNRFLRENSSNNKKLSGNIAESMHVIYPMICKNNASYNLNTDDHDNTITHYFLNLNFAGKLVDKTEGINYSFEDPELQLSFNYDGAVNKYILGINKVNDLAKYDIAFLEECKIDGSYGIAKYNIEANKGNYFNTDDAYKLFHGLNNNEPLTLDTNEIFFGLLGSKDIKLQAGGAVKLYGDNSEFTGRLMLPNTVQTVEYDNEKSKIANIVRSDSEEPFENLKYYYNGILNWDLNQNGNKLNMDIGNNTALVLKDDGAEKQEVIEITGNNSEFNGIIVTPPKVKRVIFGKNSFVRTVNINGTPLQYIFDGDNKVKDYNDYSLINNNGYKVNVESNTLARHKKNGKKSLNINVNNIHVAKHGTLTFKPGTKLIIG